MFPLSLKMYGYIAILVILAGLSIAVKVQTSRLATSKAETVKVQAAFDLFKEEVRQLGEKQKAETEAHIQADKQREEKANAENSKAKSDLAGVYAAYRGLRDSRANSGSGQLPPAPTVTSSADRTCFDSAKLTNAMGVLEAGVPNITQQGDTAIADLNSAKKWAAGQ